MQMKKAIVFSLVCVFALFLVVGCSNNVDNQDAVEEQQEDANQDTQDSGSQDAVPAETEQDVEAVAEDLENLNTVEDDLNFDDLDDLDDVLSDIENI